MTPQPSEDVAVVWLVQMARYIDRNDDLERTMCVASSRESAVGLALRLIDEWGGRWKWDSYRGLWEEQGHGDDDCAIWIKKVALDRSPWRRLEERCLWAP